MTEVTDRGRKRLSIGAVRPVFQSISVSVVPDGSQRQPAGGLFERQGNRDDRPSAGPVLGPDEPAVGFHYPFADR